MSDGAVDLRERTVVPEARGSGPDPSAFVRGADGNQQRLELLVQGARCAGCLNKIEKGVAALPGVTLARMNLTTGKLAVQWRTGRL
jgi:Cu2+-exporting ATPase